MKRLLPGGLPLSALTVLCLWGAPVAAVPAVAAVAPADKFAATDADKNGSLSPEEFKAAFPGMRDEAFAVIDKNGDKAIDRAEWDAFVKNHSAGSMGHGNMGGKPAPKCDAVPLVTPPDGK
ncbi:MAG: EF-hand domain-containing protein [Desulfovibrio sp.]|nr:EF-hand domain-containing protein [Desulfovibrio sp.]